MIDRDPSLRGTPPEAKRMQGLLFEERTLFVPNRSLRLMEGPAKVAGAVLSLAALPAVIGAAAYIGGGDFWQAAGTTTTIMAVIGGIYVFGNIGADALG